MTEQTMAKYANGACTATLKKFNDGSFIVRCYYNDKEVHNKCFVDVTKASDYAVDHIAIK